jgi:broad specificity phosphatase PhoE
VLKAMIYLLRHGAVDPPDAETLVGQSDLPLSAWGVQQAHFWRHVLASFSIHQIYCSDLVRSRHTAQIIAGWSEDIIRVMPELREINLGTWDGLTRTDVKQCFFAEWEHRQKNLFTHRPPSGESFVDLRARVLPVFKSIVRSLTGNTLIVGHAGVNRIILSHILGIPRENLFRLKQDYGSLNIIDVANGEERLVALNVPPAVVQLGVCSDFFLR